MSSLPRLSVVIFLATLLASIATTPLVSTSRAAPVTNPDGPRERINLDTGWTFFKYESADHADDLIYDVRPFVEKMEYGMPADAEPTAAVEVERDRAVLKPWILPTANPFIANPVDQHVRPKGNPGGDFPFVQSDFDDRDWKSVILPHDWAIAGPFFKGDEPEVGGGMGRLPSPGVAWYRRTLDISAEDAGKSLFLDVDGAMSYAMVWLNGQLVGGWPFGYSSFRLDLTPYAKPGETNQLAIRLDNPPFSSRWYPGGGLYRNVWLVKTDPVHVAHWGTFITTPEVSAESATINLAVTLDNDGATASAVTVSTRIHELDANNHPRDQIVAEFAPQSVTLPQHSSHTFDQSIVLDQPKLWGPLPTQIPHRYVALTTVKKAGAIVDEYETVFGIRSLRFDPIHGVFVNGERIYLQGANQHHDLGALGAAFNTRAAERQLEILQAMGCNAIRMAHNPPASELLTLADRMGFLVINESFDMWARKKTPLDYHLVFEDWSEPDMRALVRRDRNHPSVIMWSIGNEVGEQYTDEAGAEVARRLHRITKEEDPTRPTAASMNYAKPHMPLPAVTDTISLNYQGEGIRNAPAYAHLEGIRTEPLYPDFHAAFPDKMIISSENAAAVSTRGTYLFPVAAGISAPVADGQGGDPVNAHVSAYELYTAPFGSSAEKVLLSLDRHPFVAGGFVWSGWDYLGEPTPYYSARSSYFGVIDLAGFPKNRFYLYQSHWRPDYPMAHILPHWNWPDRIGEVTPVHVFTSGDEAELFLNGESLGRRAKTDYQLRLRWDDIKYEPGELKVVAYKNGEHWAESIMATTGEPVAIAATADRDTIHADGRDLSFVTIRITDSAGRTVPTANFPLEFSIEGPAEIVATDNGDPTDFTPFPSTHRHTFNGLALVIIRGIPYQPGEIVLQTKSPGLDPVILTLHTH
jgi:beta-galactosidase